MQDKQFGDKRSNHANVLLLNVRRYRIVIGFLIFITVALIHSRLDYANSLVYGVSSTYKHPQTPALSEHGRQPHLQQSGTPAVQYLMDRLHWLPIRAWIDFKIATLTYKTLSYGHPAYLRELRTNLLAHCDPVINFSPLFLVQISQLASALSPIHPCHLERHSTIR